MIRFAVRPSTTYAVLAGYPLPQEQNTELSADGSRMSAALNLFLAVLVDDRRLSERRHVKEMAVDDDGGRGCGTNLDRMDLLRERRLGDELALEGLEAPAFQVSLHRQADDDMLKACSDRDDVLGNRNVAGDPGLVRIEDGNLSREQGEVEDEVSAAAP